MLRIATMTVALLALAVAVRAQDSEPAPNLFETAAQVAARDDDASWDRLVGLVDALRARVEKDAGKVPYAGIVSPRNVRDHARVGKSTRDLVRGRWTGSSGPIGSISHSVIVIDGDWSGITGSIDHSVVVVTGNLALTGNLSNSVVVVRGDVSTMGQGEDSLVVCGPERTQSYMGQVSRCILVGNVSLMGVVENCVVFGKLTGLGVQSRATDRKDPAPVYDWIEKTRPEVGAGSGVRGPDPAGTEATPKDPAPKEPAAAGELPPLFETARAVVAKGDAASWQQLTDQVNRLRKAVGEAAPGLDLADVFDPGILTVLPVDTQGNSLKDARFAAIRAPRGQVVDSLVVVDGDYAGGEGYIKNSVVVVTGSMDFAGYVKDSLVIVRGGCAATAYAKDSLIVTGAQGKNRFAYVKGSVIVGDVTAAAYVKESAVFGRIGDAIGDRADTREHKPDGLDLKAVRGGR